MTSAITNAPERKEIRTVDVVVLNWNGRRHLETCLDALAVQQDPSVSWQVIVVDNGSTDDSIAWLEERWLEGSSASRSGETSGSLRSSGGPEVRLIQSPCNSGFCGGNNLAIAASEADAVVLLNNDTAPRPDWLRELAGALQAAPADVAAVSGMLVDWDGERVDFVEGQLTFDGHAFQRGFGTLLGASTQPESGAELLFACGGNMIIRRESFLDAGGFDPMYFAYLEDVDLGWRLWSGGERVLLCREAVARHRSMASSDQLGQNRRGFLFERNAFLTAFKNYDAEFFDKLMPSILMTFLARTRTLVADNNEGGELLRVDPYRDSGTVTAPASSTVAPPQPTLWQKWRGWGTRELSRRGVNKVRRRLAAAIQPTGSSDSTDQGVPAQPELVLLNDQRSVAQLQAANFLLDHLDDAHERRREVQRRRQRTDREIFAKFPLALVATYPGDESLFASEGFRALLPENVEIQVLRLDDLMEPGSS